MVREEFGHTQTNTVSAVSDVLETWKPSDIVKYAALHVGVNDARNGLTASDIAEGIKSCLNQMHVIFPNAYIAFSEILYVGINRESAVNKCIYQVNTLVKQFVEDENYLIRWIILPKFED